MIPRRPLLWILLLALLLRLGFSIGVMRGVLHLAPEQEVTDGYHLIAENMLHGLGYRQYADWPPAMQRPPGYPVFLYTVFQVFGANYLAVQIAQALLGAIGCWILFRFGRWILSERLGLAAAMLFAVYPAAIEYSGRLYVENLYYPLFFAFAYLLCRASIHGSARAGLAAGIAWALGILTRGTLLVLPLVLPLGILLSREHRRSGRRLLLWLAPAILGAALVAGPWTARNVRLTGSFVPVSAWGWAPFYHGLQCSKRMLHWDDLHRIDKEAERKRHEIVIERLYGGDASRAYASAREFVRHERVARDLVVSEIRSDPWGTAGRAAAGIVFTWFQTLGRGKRLLSLVVHLPLMALFVAGAIRMARRHPESFARAWPALGIILTVNLFQALVFPHVRYMSPAIALSFVFGGLPLIELLERRRA